MSLLLSAKNLTCVLVTAEAKVNSGML